MERPMRVPTVSRNAMMKMVRTTGKKRISKTLPISSWKRIGEMSGGRLTNSFGMGVTPKAMERVVVATMPITMAPRTCRVIRKTVRR